MNWLAFLKSVVKYMPSYFLTQLSSSKFLGGYTKVLFLKKKKKPTEENAFKCISELGSLCQIICLIKNRSSLEEMILGTGRMASSEANVTLQLQTVRTERQANLQNVCPQTRGVLSPCVPTDSFFLAWFFPSSSSLPKVLLPVFTRGKSLRREHSSQSPWQLFIAPGSWLNVHSLGALSARPTEGAGSPALWPHDTSLLSYLLQI